MKKGRINVPNLEKMCEELHLKFHKDTNKNSYFEDFYCAYLPGATVTDENDDEYPLFTFNEDSVDASVHCRTGLNLEFKCKTNNVKIMWGDSALIHNIEDLKKTCKSIITSYTQFLLYKKMFNEYKRKQNIKKDFE